MKCLFIQKKLKYNRNSNTDIERRKKNSANIWKFNGFRIKVYLKGGAMFCVCVLWHVDANPKLDQSWTPNSMTRTMKAITTGRRHFNYECSFIFGILETFDAVIGHFLALSLILVAADAWIKWKSQLHSNNFSDSTTVNQTNIQSIPFFLYSLVTVIDMSYYIETFKHNYKNKTFSSRSQQMVQIYLCTVQQILLFNQREKSALKISDSLICQRSII